MKKRLLSNLCKTHTLRNKTGKWLFFEENRGKVYYSLVSMEGDLLRKGEMSIAIDTFVHYMESLGFDYPKEGDLL